MKKSVALILMLLLILACSAQAEPCASSLGYSIELAPGWQALTPESADAFAERLNKNAVEFLAMAGLTTDYLDEYENRAFDFYLNLDGIATDGNFIIRRLSDELGNSFGDFEGCRSYLENEVIPVYVSYYGAKVVREAEVCVVNGHEFACIEVKVGDRVLSQWITCNPDGDAWYNFTFTKVSEENRNLVLETLTFPGEADSE